MSNIFYYLIQINTSFLKHYGFIQKNYAPTLSKHLYCIAFHHPLLFSFQISYLRRWKCGNPTWRKSCWESRHLSWMEKNSTSWTSQNVCQHGENHQKQNQNILRMTLRGRSFLEQHTWCVFFLVFDVVLCSWDFGDWFWMLLSWSITFALPLTCKSSSRYAGLLEETEQAVLFV